MTDWSKVDLSTIDLRTLTPRQWTALKAEVHRRAVAERCEFLRGLFVGLRRVLAGRSASSRRREADTFAPSHKRPHYLGGRM